MTRLFLSSLFLATAIPAVAEVDFKKDIYPLLQKSCLECHKSPHKVGGKEVKPKGGLALDSAAAILRGGGNGAAVTAEDPDNSSIYTRTILPQTHEDAMPPKGKGTPLTFKETELIKTWILEGASFGDWKGVGDAPAVSAPAGGLTKKADPLAVGVGKASDEAIRTLTATGALVTPVETNSPLLRVEWVSGASRITDKEIPKILALGNNVTELSLANTKITDAALEGLAKLTKLTWLNLSNTAITDSGAAHLKALTNLTYLNVYGTNLSDASLEHFVPMRNLKSLHAWKSRISSTGAEKLKKTLSGVRVVIE